MKPNELTKRPGFGTNNPWGGKVGQCPGCVSWENCRVILRTIYTRFVFAACTVLELVITKPWGNEARNGHGDELAAPMSHLGSMFS